MLTLCSWLVDGAKTLVEYKDASRVDTHKAINPGGLDICFMKPGRHTHGRHEGRVLKDCDPWASLTPAVDHLDNRQLLRALSVNVKQMTPDPAV